MLDIRIEISDRAMNVIVYDENNKMIGGEYLDHSIFDSLGFKRFRINRAIIDILKRKKKIIISEYKTGMD